MSSSRSSVLPTATGLDPRLRGSLSQRRRIPQPAYQKVPNLLERKFTTAAPYRKCVGDIPYLLLVDGRNLRSATVIDCCSRCLAGWAIADHMCTELVSDGFLLPRRPAAICPECLSACSGCESPCPDPTFPWLYALLSNRVS